MIRRRINFPCDVLILEQLLPIQSNHQTTKLDINWKDPVGMGSLVKSLKALGCVQMLL